MPNVARGNQSCLARVTGGDLKAATTKTMRLSWEFEKKNAGFFIR